MCDFCIPVDFLGINDLKKIKKGRNFFEGQGQGHNEKFDIFIIFSPGWDHMELI